MTLLATPAEVPANGDLGQPSARFASRQIALTIDRVSFAHEPGRSVLHELDLVVHAGEVLTLVGSSGSGKSTLFSLVMGFVTPQQGRILINGQDLATLDIHAWRQHIGWVPQRAHVFHGSLRDNLLIAAPDSTEAQLQAALGAAALTDVVARLPQGPDTSLGEHGQGLSGGERQRLGLARAWLRDAPLLLLDEPTQHLDAATAATINRALATLAEGRTVIRIAHRLGNLAEDARVAVLASGKIVETGRVDQLRSAGGVFARSLAAELAA